MKPSQLRPMLCQIGTPATLTSKEYIFEPKLDGIRALCFVNKTVKFLSRTGHDLTHSYDLGDMRKYITAQHCILDGEIISYNKEGVPSFTALQQGHPAYYVVFDILMYNRKLLIHLPLLERKRFLQQTVRKGTRIEHIFFVHNGKALWRAAHKHKLEGVIAKHLKSRYYPGERTNAWLKIKFEKSIDCVIVGYTTHKRLVSSLAVAVYTRAGMLRYIGRVGTGFSEKTIALLASKLHKIPSLHCPITEWPEDHTIARLSSIIWVKPRIVCEIKYSELTRFGIMRIPRFVRIRTDKKVQDCILEDQV